jgi:type II secretory ATPase GspE/PulE/Tfp pilus assembly ATPase PilB-like protein
MLRLDPQGRIGVFEVWHQDESDYRLILNHADEHSLRANLSRRGLKTVLDDGMAKVGEGTTSLIEVQQMGAHVGF